MPCFLSGFLPHLRCFFYALLCFVVQGVYRYLATAILISFIPSIFLHILCHVIPFFVSFSSGPRSRGVLSFLFLPSILYSFVSFTSRDPSNKQQLKLTLSTSPLSQSLIAYCQATKDPLLPSVWGPLSKSEDPYAPPQQGCCVVIVSYQRSFLFLSFSFPAASPVLQDLAVFVFRRSSIRANRVLTFHFLCLFVCFVSGHSVKCQQRV